MLTTLGFLISGLLLMQQPDTPDKSDKPEAKGKQLGTVLGKPIYESARNKNLELEEDLERLFLRPVEEHYLAEQKIDPAEELAKRIPNRGMRGAALPMVRQRVLHKHLYDKSGGQVLLTAFGPIAYDAYKKWLTEREQEGEFKIEDPEHRKLLLKKWGPETGPGLTTSPQVIKQAFDPAAIERYIKAMAETPVDAVGNPKLKLIGQVLSQKVYVHQQQLADKAQLPGLLRDLIVPKLEENYRKEHPKLEPSDAEIDVINARFKADAATAKFIFQEALDKVMKRLETAAANSDEYKELQAQKKKLERQLEGGDSRPRATTIAKQRKLQQHLYDQFGGGRALETAQGVEAFDAQKKWVEDQERLGAFQISDAGLRESFYKYWAAGPRRKGETLVEDIPRSTELLNGGIGKQKK